MALTRRRIAIVGVAAAMLGGAAVPTFAGAVVYCVPADNVDASCDPGQGHATIASALSAAQSSLTVADTVHIDTGSYSATGLSYSSANPANVLTLRGEGAANTVITMDTTGSGLGMLIDGPPGSTVSDLAMTIPANVDVTSDTGIQLGGDTTGQDLLVIGPAATNARGVLLFNGPAVLQDSTVTLQIGGASTNTGVLSSSNSTVIDSEITSDRGVRHQVGGFTTTVERSTIVAQTGVSGDTGTMVVRNSLIDLGNLPNAVGIQPVNFNNSTLPIAAVVEGSTIVNGGTQSNGIHVQGDSDATPPINEGTDLNTDGESSTAAVSNTIIYDVTTPLRIEADRAETASVTTSYSNYNTLATVITSDLTPGGGAGTATLDESNRTNLNPAFVDEMTGDYHLLASSPLIDLGDPADPAPGDLDIDGDAREIFGKDGCGPRRDIGADEFDPVMTPTLLDCIPPDSTIDSGPTGAIADSTPTFAFSANEASTFQCRFDGGAFAACSAIGSHTPATALADGAHTFEVRATDLSSNVELVPASRAFSVDTTAPDTSIAGKAKVKSKKKKAKVSYTLTSTEAGSSFQCSIDGGAFVACVSPFVTKLRRGKHTLTVRATDALGNVETSPATFTTKVTKKKKKKK
jgi:hypothetical protein